MLTDEAILSLSRACIKEAVVLTCLILGFTFDHCFGSKKHKLLGLPLLSTELCLPSDIYGLVLYLQSETLNLHEYILVSFHSSTHIRYSTLSLAGSQFIFLSAIEEDTTRYIHNQNVVELSHYIIIF